MLRILTGIPICPSLIFGPFRKIIVIQFHSACVYKDDITASRLGKGLFYRRSGGNSIKAIMTDDNHGSHFVILGILRQQLTNYLRESSAVRAPGDDYRRAGQMDFRDYDENDEEF